MNANQLDSKTIKNLKKGDIEAFNMVYTAYKDGIYFFVLSLLKNPADAEEVVQETFIKVYLNISSLKKITAFHAWIYTIARNQSMQYLNKVEHKRYDDFETILETYADQNTTTSILNKKEIVDVVISEIRKLSSKHQQIAQLYYFQNMKKKDIAKILNINEKTVRRNIKYIEKAIQDGMKEKGYKKSVFFTFAGTPLVYLAMQKMLYTTKLSSTHSLVLQQKIIDSFKQSDIKYQQQIRMPTKASVMNTILIKVISVVFIASVLSLALNITNNSTKILKDEVNINQVIKTITHKKEQTRAPLRIDMELYQTIDKDMIQITANQRQVPFTLDNNKITFQANQNGDYRIKIKGILGSREVKIQNIDATVPVLVDTKYTQRGLQLIFLDEDNRIDFNQSYVVHQNKTFSLSNDGIIDGNVVVAFMVYVYDTKGEIIKFKIKPKVNINKE